jgi:ribosome maturation factor RimP
MKLDVETLREKIEPLIESMNFELAEIAAPVVGGRLILRLFIYSPAGVTLDDCALVSREVSDMLDTEDVIDGRFNLEVSSLGLDRSLITPRDFQRRVGEMVKVSYQDNGVARVAEGMLEESDSLTIKIKDDEKTVVIPVEAKPEGKIIF